MLSSQAVCLTLLISLCLWSRSHGQNVIFEANITLGEVRATAYPPYGLMGNNVEWGGRGDGLLVDPVSNPTLPFPTPQQPLYNAVAALKPSYFRYPGGSDADLFNWQAGQGNLSERQLCGNPFDSTLEIVYFGTLEYLEFCEFSGAQPIITVNIFNGTAEEAAAWVNYTNIIRPISRNTGNRLGPVLYWEIGNEPYGSPSRLPNVTAIAINKFIKAMKAVDPTIKVSIPLATAVRNGQTWVTSFWPLNYLNMVLQALTEPFDAISVHDAYLPLASSPVSQEEVYLAAMAAYKSIETDMKNIRQALALYQPYYVNVPFAVTEYNYLNTMFVDYLDSTSYLGALYIADVIRFLSSRDDILMANYWSSSQDVTFGTVLQNVTTLLPRPSYHILQELSSILAQDVSLLNSTVVSPTFDSPNISLCGNESGLPVITVLATIQQSAGDNQLRVLVINKDLRNSANVTIFAGGAVSSFAGALGSVKEFYSPNISIMWENIFNPGAASSLAWSVPVNLTLFGAESFTVLVKNASMISLTLQVPVQSSSGTAPLTCWWSSITQYLFFLCGCQQ